MNGSHHLRLRWESAAVVASFLLLMVQGAYAQGVNCVQLLPLFQQGLDDASIAGALQLPLAAVQSCRHELSRPLPVGPAGAPPAGAAGVPPAGAAGRPPMGAAGPPPMGAAGPPPVGSEIRRLPPR